MKLLFALSGALAAWLSGGGAGENVLIPVGHTNSAILGTQSAGSSKLAYHGQGEVADLEQYRSHLNLYVSVVAPGFTSASLANGWTCSAGMADPGNAKACSTTNLPKTNCSVMGSDRQCSAQGPNGGPAGGSPFYCSTDVPDYSVKCSVMSDPDLLPPQGHSQCSVKGGGPNSNYNCSAFGTGICSVFSSSEKIDPNSCSAYGPVGDKPHCSTFGTSTELPPLCSVFKGLENARCTIQGTNEPPGEGGGPGDGYCSTLTLEGLPWTGGPTLCSVIDMSTVPPHVDGPDADGVCWGVPPE